MSKITTIEAGKQVSFFTLLKEIWLYRELIWSFSARDIKVKYFQTIFGPLWVAFTPLITVGVMTFVFGLFIKVPSDGLPYIVFYLVAIVPWYAFVALLNQTISSLEAHSALINKIYFPRIVIPASYALNTSIDFFVGMAISTIFILYFSLPLLNFIIFIPILLFIQIAWALGLGLLLAPYNARFRDVKHVIPLFIQLYYFANPIMYPVSVAPTWATWLFKINPFAIIIATYRSVLNGQGPDWLLLGYAFVFSILVLVSGIYLFLRKSQDLADIL